MRPGRLIGGKYRLELWLGSGAMGHVWRAKHVELGTSVAVKVLGGSDRNPVSVQRFRKEARVAAELKSAHVVDVRDCGVDGDVPYIVMELLEGESMAARLARPPAVELRELSNWIRQAALALELAHGRGLVHRDIKPSNLFLVHRDGECTLKLLDFGVVKSLAEGKAGESTLVGSPAYLSPEQARGEGVDHTTDLWALGTIVYRVITGVEPFGGSSLAEIVERVCLRPVPRPSELRPQLPKALDAVVERALSRDRAHRFRSASELSAALDWAIAGHEDVPLPSAPRDPPTWELAPRADPTRSWSSPRAARKPGGWLFSTLSAAATIAVLAALATAAHRPQKRAQETNRSPAETRDGTLAQPLASSEPGALAPAPASASASAVAAPTPRPRAQPTVPPAARRTARTRASANAERDPIFGLPIENLEHAHTNPRNLDVVMREP